MRRLNAAAAGRLDGSFLLALLLSALLGLALCFVPLFDLVGYESSMAVGVYVHLAAAALALGEARRGAASLSTRDPWANVERFLKLVARCQLLILPALLMLSLNALRVTNCDWAQGLGFFALGPPCAALMGAMVGWCAQRALPTRRRAAWVVALIGIVANALALGVHILLEPPINGHQWAIGYLNGSIYDEAIRIPPGLLWYRVANVALALAAVSAVELRWREARGAPGGRRLLLFALLCALIWSSMTLVEQRFGVRVTRQTIARELGGRLETEHFIIYYPDVQSYREQLDLLAEDHEFRYAEMRAYFDTDPVALHGRKVKSFVYPSTETKGHLMGARRTLIAKIWLGEIHIMWRGYGTHLLAHELAHVFTEPFASGPLKLSMQNGLGVNMGLVEGIATAADAPPSELTLHESSAAMRRLDLAPDLGELVGAAGFWTQASGRAYTLMGSFVQHLVDSRGIEAFKRLYADGDFEAAYGESAEALVGEWEAMLDQLALSQIQLDITRYRYEKESIFGRVCARTIAELKRRAAERAERGDVAAARALYGEIIGYDPLATRHRISFASLMLRAEENDEALDVLDQLIEERGAELAPAQRAQIDEMRGDLLWRQGQIEPARERYAACLDVGVLNDARRLLLAKRGALAPERAAHHDLARRYLLDDLTDSIALYYPTRWRAERPDDALVAYMLGRRLWGARRWEFALEPLKLAQRELPEGLLKDEALSMLGQTLMHLERYEEAEGAFEQLASSEWSRLRLLSEEWRARVTWKRAGGLK